MMSLLMSAVLGAAFQSAAPGAPPPPPSRPSQGETAADKNAPAHRARVTAPLPLLFSADDYPSEALMKGETGTVGLRASVGRDGRVTRCDITASSGSSSLDRTTCGIIQRRARFTPARDVSGNAVEDAATARIRWELPEPLPLAFADQHERFVVTFDRGAQVVKCRAEFSYDPLPPPSQCAVGIATAKEFALRSWKQFNFASRDMILESGALVGGQESANNIGRRPGETIVFMIAAAVTIEPSGAIVNCAAAAGNMVGPTAACDTFGKAKFDALAAGERDQSARHAGL
jgi:protein TonB